MLGYWFKKRFLISVVVSILLSVTYIVAFVIPFSKSVTENYMKTAVFEETNISYDIPSPTKAQLEELLSLDFVDDAFGYYVTSAQLRFDGDTIETNLMISDCVDSIEMTMFNEERTIASANDANCIPLYIGEDFAQLYGVTIGDVLDYSGYELTVVAICEPDSYKSCVLIPIESGELLDMIESRANSYSGAYISVNDNQAAERYLRTYKPEGRLRDRSSFSSEEEYQIHFDSWQNANYYNEITSFEERLDGARLVDTNMIWIGSVSLVVLLIGIDLILYLRKSERSYFKTKKSKIGLRLYYVLSFIFDLVNMAIAAMLTTYIYSLINKGYSSQSAYVEAIIISSSSILLALIINLIINNIHVNRIVLSSCGVVVSNDSGISSDDNDQRNNEEMNHGLQGEVSEQDTNSNVINEQQAAN